MANITLKSFIEGLEEERDKMKEVLTNYEGRCDQLRTDISRITFAISQGKAAMQKDQEDMYK